MHGEFQFPGDAEDFDPRKCSLKDFEQCPDTATLEMIAAKNSSLFADPILT